MAFESLQPLELSDNEKLMESYFEGFETEYPDMLVVKIPLEEALNDIRSGKSYEI